MLAVQITALLWLALPGSSLGTSHLPITRQAEPSATVIAKGGQSQLDLGELGLGLLSDDSFLALRFQREFAGGALPTAGEALAQLDLISGERLTGRVVGGDGERLELELLANVPLELGIEEIRGLVFPARVESAEASAAVVAPEVGDRLFWIRGATLDRVDGTLDGFSGKGVRFESDRLGLRQFAWEEVGALFIEPLEPFAGSANEDKDSSAVAITLADGSRVRGQLLRLNENGLRLKLGNQRELDLPLSAVVEVARDGAGLRFLGELTPSQASFKSPFGDVGNHSLENPFGDVGNQAAGDDLQALWSHRVDRSVTGSPLSVAKRWYPRGIGVHAPSVLTWKLPAREGSALTLRGSAALDDQVPSLPGRNEASVEFRIWLDGGPSDERQPDWSSGVLRANSGAQAFEVPLGQASELTLEVHMADNLHMCDRANWLDLMLFESE